MSIYHNMFKQKKLALIVLFLAMILSSFSVKAQQEEDSDAWVQSIDLVNLIAKRMVVGDLETILLPNFEVFDSNGKKLSSSVLKPGLRVSTIPEYRDNKAYIKTITVVE